MRGITRRSFIIAATLSSVFVPAAMARGADKTLSSLAEETITATLGNLSFTYPATWSVLDSTDEQENSLPLVTVGLEDGSVSFTAQCIDMLYAMMGASEASQFVQLMAQSYADQAGYEIGETSTSERNDGSWFTVPYATTLEGRKVSGTMTFIFSDAGSYALITTAYPGSEDIIENVLATVQIKADKAASSMKDTRASSSPSTAFATFDGSGMQDTGAGEMHLTTASGTSENGAVPVVAIAQNTSLIQIDITVNDMEPMTYTVYVDGIENLKLDVAHGFIQSTLTLSGAMLNPGVHIVELTNLKSGKSAVYKLARYEVQTH